jgi:tRNA dimethylallyltransferase
MGQRSVVIVGPTASGKSDCAIAIAQKYNGEVISSDSRQIYRGMDIGSGKEPGTLTEITSHDPITKRAYITDGIAHYMIDIVHPNTEYSAGKFVKKAKKIRADIWKRNALPIICGGTLFWAQALVENNSFTAVPPDRLLRKRLQRLSVDDLFTVLQKKDPLYAEKVDRANPVRVIRAIEIANALGSVPLQKKPQINYENTLIIAITSPTNVLHRRIEKRLKERLIIGMCDEVERLHVEYGVSWKRLESFGLEYKWCAFYLQGKISYDTMYEHLLRDIKHYAKRQMTWLRRWERSGAKIYHVRNQSEALQRTKKFFKRM